MSHRILSEIVHREIISDGWSTGQKYRISDREGHQYLLRISDPKKQDVKEFEFKMMQDLFALGIPMPQPLEFGVCDQGVYSVQAWIEGYDMKKVLPCMSVGKQYEFGIKAGEILRQIHEVQPSVEVEDWERRFNRKIDNKINQYVACNLKYAKGNLFIEYIQAHRYLLKNRPQSLHHGDYHIGNMLFTDKEQLCIIDFDSMDIGDPWEEFNRIVWCAQKSPAFANGMVNGYFPEKVPQVFWELLVLYISSNTLGALPWSVNFGETQMMIMQKQAQEVLSWYDDMRSVIPNWYSQNLSCCS